MSIGVVVGFGAALAAVPAAQATTTCTHATLFATPGGNTLKKYNVDGTSAGADVSLATSYFDIAFDFIGQFEIRKNNVVVTKLGEQRIKEISL